MESFKETLQKVKIRNNLMKPNILAKIVWIWPTNFKGLSCQGTGHEFKMA